MARGWVHTVHKDGFWVNELEDGPRLSSHSTKETAVAAGRLEAQGRRTEHLIHNLDGTIGERHVYAGNP
jgi:hypothetical protein